jgi:hypothetical protein
MGRAVRPVASVTRPLRRAARPIGFGTRPLRRTARPIGFVARPGRRTARPIGRATQYKRRMARPIGRIARPAGRAARPRRPAPPRPSSMHHPRSHPASDARPAADSGPARGGTRRHEAPGTSPAPSLPWPLSPGRTGVRMGEEGRGGEGPLTLNPCWIRGNYKRFPALVRRTEYHLGRDVFPGVAGEAI